MKQKLLLSLFLCFLAFAQVFAQERTVSGKVTDPETGEGIPGVNIIIKGTNVGTVTDPSGSYKLNVPKGATIIFQAVGYASKEVLVEEQTTVDLVLQFDTKQLGEVIVTGYNSFVKEKSNISAVTVGAQSIQSRPNPSFLQTLSGQVAGLNIATGTGQPGGNSIVNLRGVASINGDTEPLFIIDGTPVNQDNFRSLNPNEIASVTVLKDAGATAIYGNRGANGVIVIETKKGSFDSPLQVTYTYQRISNTLQSNKYDLMNSQEQLRLERTYGNGLGTELSDSEINAFSTTNWADYFFSTGVGTNHNIQFSKGGNNISTYFSLGFLDQEGILVNSGLRRYNMRANINGKANNSKFTYGVNLSINYSENNEPNNIGTGGINRNYILGAYQSVPYISPDDYVDGRSLLSPLSFTNTPLFLIDLQRTFTRKEDELRLIGTVSIGYEIIKGLNVNLRAGGDFAGESLLRAESPTSFNALLFAQSGNTTPGFQNQQYTQEFTYNQVTSINYQKNFGKHGISAGVYAEYFKAHLDTYGYFARGLSPQTYSPGDGGAFVSDNAANDFFVDDANADIAESGLFSYFGTIDYDYDSKYGFSATLRRDASSRFAESNRWGTFYSFSARWNIHNESFAKNLPFNILKLRASYGTNGNQDITGTGYFGALDLTRALFATGRGYGGANAIFLAQIPNNTLKWEVVAQGNIGIDAELLNGRLRTTLEGYIKTTSELFQSRPVSAINSVTALNGNIGKLANRGFDFQIGYDLFRSQDPNGLKLTLNFLGNYNKQEILELPNNQTELIGTGRVGGSLFEYFDYRYAGVNPANGNLLYLTSTGEVTENPNVNTDRVWLGKNIFPEFQGSFGLNVDYKGFFLTLQFNYIVGVDRYDFDLAGFLDPTSIGQFRHTRDIQRAWTPGNRVTDVPSLTASNIDLDGTRFLSDADYVRLRFLSVGYNIPKRWLDKIKFRAASIFVNGENLFTLTKWRGFDAEALDNTSRIYPTPRTITLGVEIGF